MKYCPFLDNNGLEAICKKSKTNLNKEKVRDCRLRYADCKTYKKHFPQQSIDKAIKYFTNNKLL